MAHEAFEPTEEWPLQREYKIAQHQQIQRWGERVVAIIERMSEAERQERVMFFEFLMTSVERGDRLTTETVLAMDGYARHYIEGLGPYERCGGSIESAPGHAMCQAQFEGLFTIFQAGKSAAQSET